MYPYKSSHDVIDKSEITIITRSAVGNWLSPPTETNVRQSINAQKLSTTRRPKEKIEVWEQIKKSKYRQLSLQGGGKEYEEKPPITLNNLNTTQIDEWNEGKEERNTTLQM
jgi:hypothetical protein